uniref:Uncharacterized protein n=1 Tax=Ditylum brightwellii TaxID=49249 RepID=A0A7S4RYY7_9STRA
MPSHVVSYLNMEKPTHFVSSSSSSSLLYPSVRRQLRLSYLVPALLEKLERFGSGGIRRRRNRDDDDEGMVHRQRQMWLEVPSVQLRLKAVLERLEALNDEMMGEFQ